MATQFTERSTKPMLLLTLHERVDALEAVLEKRRKQVRDSHAPDSANREIKITQMGKQRDRDHEDLQALNIALDSKQ